MLRPHLPSVPCVAWVALGVALLSLGLGTSAFAIALLLLTGEVTHAQ